MIPGFRHWHPTTMLRALFVLLCLGIVTLEVVAADQMSDVPRAVESLQQTGRTAGDSTTAHHDLVASPAHGQHDSASASAAPDHSRGMMQSTGKHGSHCQTPCDNEPSCSSVCALACSPSGSSAGSICTAAYLPQPRAPEAVLPLSGTDMFVGMVSPPLYRPPII